MIATPGSTIYPTSSWYTTGLTLGVRIRRKSDQVDVVARTTSGIVESPAGSGTYTATLTAPSTAGEYEVFWDDGTIGPGHVAAEDLTVTWSAGTSSTPSGTDLCTVADVRQRLQLQTTSQDALIQSLITRASSVIPARYGREFADQGAATRRLPVAGTLVNLGPWDLRSVTTMTLHPESSAPVVLGAGDYLLKPVQQTNLGTYRLIKLSSSLNLVSANAQTFGVALLDVNGSWGAASVADDVRLAAELTVCSWIDRSVASYSGSDGVDDGRSVQPDRDKSYAIPWSAHIILDAYSRKALG